MRSTTFPESAASTGTSKSSGKTRLRNERQNKITSMVDGYASTETLAMGLRNALLVWVLPGVVAIGLGISGTRSEEGGQRNVDAFNAVMSAVLAGSFLLSLVTLLVSIVWAVRTWANIERVGKRARIDLWSVGKLHLVAAGLALGLFGLASVLPSSLSALLTLAAVFAFLAVSVVPFAVLAVVSLFWRAGTPPADPEEQLPAYGVLWFGSWWTFTTLLALSEIATATLAQLSVASIAAGVACVIASVTAAKLVTEISRRFDERLLAIIGDTEIEDEDQAEVTSQQIESAWQTSEALVTFHGH